LFCFYGVVNAQWTSTVSWPGKAIGTATTEPALKQKISITVGSNGSVYVFYGLNFFNNRDAMYAKRVNPEGVLHWGTELTARDLNSNFVVEDVITGGNNGACILGTFNSQAENQNVFLQRINSSGKFTMQAAGVKKATALQV